VDSVRTWFRESLGGMDSTIVVESALVIVE